MASEINQKSRYIDDLMSKIQNLYQKTEYYKEDMFKYQDEYSRTKDLLEIEKKHKMMIKENYEETCKKLTELKHEFENLNSEIEASRQENEKKVEEFVKTTIDNSACEISRIRTSHEIEKNEFFRNQNVKLTQIQETNNIFLMNLRNYHEKKVNEIQKFYESRISSFINEISFAEAKYSTEILYLQDTIANLNKEVQSLTMLNNFLAEKATCKEKINKEYEHIISELSIKDEEIEFEAKIAEQRNIEELEQLKSNYEENKQKIVLEYEKILRINQKHKQDEIERITNIYKSNIEKIKSSVQEAKIKKKKHFEVQIEVLLSQVEQLEKEKCEIQIKNYEKEFALQTELKNVKNI